MFKRAKNWIDSFLGNILWAITAWQMERVYNRMAKLRHDAGIKVIVNDQELD